MATTTGMVSELYTDIRSNKKIRTNKVSKVSKPTNQYRKPKRR